MAKEKSDTSDASVYDLKDLTVEQLKERIRRLHELSNGLADHAAKLQRHCEQREADKLSATKKGEKDSARLV